MADIIIDRYIWIYLILFQLFANIHVLSWPAPYKAFFNQEDNFVISSDIDSYDEDSEEIQEEVSSEGLLVDDEEIDLLHTEVSDFKQDETSNLKLEDKTGFHAELFNRSKLQRHKELLINFKHLIKKDVSNKTEATEEEQVHEVRRRESNDSAEESVGKEEADEEPEYNYDELKDEYNDLLRLKMQSGEEYKYKEGKKPEETLGEAIHETVDFKKPANCSQEESKRIGVKAMECLFDDLKHSQSKAAKRKIAKHIVKIIIVWLVIYAIIATALWCQRGWCCCCCPCKFCNPVKVAQDVKLYMVNNPPGILLQENGKEDYYKPSEYEVRAYERLERQVLLL